MHSTPSLFSTLCLLMASAALAYPNGAPACVVNEARIQGMGGRSRDLGYRLRAPRTFTPGQPAEFVLDGSRDYKGLLLYVESSSDAKTRVGNFGVPTGFKSNKDKCDAQAFTAGPVGALTHASATSKPAGTAFIWTPDATAKCEDVTVHAVVAQEQQDWQILPVVTISCGAGSDQAPADNGSTDPVEADYGDDGLDDFGDDSGDYGDGSDHYGDDLGGNDVQDNSREYGGQRSYGDSAPSRMSASKEPCEPGDDGYGRQPQGKYVQRSRERSVIETELSVRQRQRVDRSIEQERYGPPSAEHPSQDMEYVDDFRPPVRPVRPWRPMRSWRPAYPVGDDGQFEHRRPRRHERQCARAKRCRRVIHRPRKPVGDDRVVETRPTLPPAKPKTPPPTTAYPTKPVDDGHSVETRPAVPPTTAYPTKPTEPPTAYPSKPTATATTQSLKLSSNDQIATVQPTYVDSSGSGSSYQMVAPNSDSAYFAKDDNAY